MKNEDKYIRNKYNTCVQSSEDILESIALKFRQLQNTIDILREENIRMKDNMYKDEQMNKLKEENIRLSKDYYRGFPISEGEKKQIDEFIKLHSKGKNHGAIGGAFTYVFIPTSIGVIGKVKAPNGDELVFQDL